jgi:hypothetical protein
MLEFYEGIKQNLILPHEGLQQTAQASPAGDIRKKDLLQRKFFLAGCSARFFFGFNISVATRELDKHLQMVDDFKSYVEGNTGQKVHRVINHLFGNFDTYTCIVSEYALRYTTIRSDCGFLNYLLSHDVVKKNPAAKGWVVELNVLVM